MQIIGTQPYKFSKKSLLLYASGVAVSSSLDFKLPFCKKPTLKIKTI